ncbi:MAG TPA: ABATE domain-containing protein [Pyrinomonadaceae bacterium]|jgi:predicted RNA-binding Zn ribbon-like protein|nr:ABATE domain-containing protein [Pyrinomonadaceae bacterium]
MIVETGTRAATEEMVGGRLCLDFANTVHSFYAEEKEAKRDELGSYADLVEWSREAGVITDAEARRLLREAKGHPVKADRALERAKILREVIFKIFAATARERSPGRDDLQFLNCVLAESLTHARVVAGADGFVWGWAEEDTLDQLLWPLARSAADLLTSDELSRTRECGGPACTWLFMDTSKNRSRRWCAMKGCGNRAKSRRHYERTRAAAQETTSG